MIDARSASVASGARHLGHQVQAGEHPVAGRRVLAHDHVAGLLAAEREAAFGHRLEHVAVADAGLHDRDAVLGHRAVQSEVAHHGRDERVVHQVPALLHRHRQDRHDLVAVDDAAARVHREAAVGVAVVGDADVGSDAHDVRRPVSRGASSRRRR